MLLRLGKNGVICECIAKHSGKNWKSSEKMIDFDLGFWDYLLIGVVAVQGTFLAYVYHPKWKSLLMTLPFPFSIAYLAVAQPVNATNMFGLVLLLFYIHAVRILYTRLKLPITLSIFLAALLYCVIGVLIRERLSDGHSIVFWSATAVTFLAAFVMLKMFPHRNEDGQKSPMPVWLKLITIVAVVSVLVVIKRGLGGFVTMFPMVSIVAAYEARSSLWTVSRQIALVMLVSGAMIIAMWLSQVVIGPYWSLLVGWLVFLSILVPTTRRQWRKHYGEMVANSD